MSKNIVSNVVPPSKGFIQTKLIFKTIMVMVAIFGLLGSALPFYSAKAAGTIIVDDIGDKAYQPLLSNTNGLGTGTQKTLRWAIEKANRECDGTPTKIQFAPVMKVNGLAAPTVTQVVAGGDGDKPGKYSPLAGDEVYRISLNTYLPDLICIGTEIDGLTNNNNSLIGTVRPIGAPGSIDDKTSVQIKRPRIEIMPKLSYKRPTASKYWYNGGNGLDSITAFGGAKKYDGTRNCGLALKSNDQKVTNISIHGFGGNGINDGNICVVPYGSGDAIPIPDLTGPVNPEADVTKDYFPQSGAIASFFKGKVGTPKVQVSGMVSFVDPTANIPYAGVVTVTDPVVNNVIPGPLGGTGIENYNTYPSIYVASNNSTRVTAYTNESVFADPFDQLMGVPVRGILYSNDSAQNTTGVVLYLNVVGATAAVQSPSIPTLGKTYDVSQALFMRTAPYQSLGSGVYAANSDGGVIQNNIIAYNGGITGSIAGNSSASNVVFDVSGYGPVNTYTEDAATMNAERWDVISNEIYFGVVNDRSFGGNGIFTNSNQNSIPGAPSIDHFRFQSNDVYENGGAGMRTFVPLVDIIGNRINRNGQHNNIGTINSVINTPAGSYSDPAGSFKHGIWLECGEGYIVHNEISENVGSAVAVAGGNMFCQNGGQNQLGGNVISENSMWGNQKLGIDLFKENNVSANLAANSFAPAGAIYSSGPANNVNFEKPIGSANDTDSLTQNTGIDPATGVNRKYVSLNTFQSLDVIKTEAFADYSTYGGDTDPSAATYITDKLLITKYTPLGDHTKLINGNLATPFPVFTTSTQDCSTGKISLHGYVTKGAVVEVFTPDIKTIQSYEEGRTYLFDFADDKSFVPTVFTDSNTDVGAYNNDDVKDLPYYDPVTGIISPLSLSAYIDPSTGKAVPTIDKVKTGETMTGNWAHEFTVETNLVAGNVITATATDYTNSLGEVGTTSEFTPNFLVNPINPCRDLTIEKENQKKTEKGVATIVNGVSQDNEVAVASIDSAKLNVPQPFDFKVQNLGINANPSSDIIIVEDTIDANYKALVAADFVTTTPWDCRIDTADARHFVCFLYASVANTKSVTALAKDAFFPTITVNLTPITKPATPSVIKNIATVKRVNDTPEYRNNFLGSDDCTTQNPSATFVLPANNLPIVDQAMLTLTDPAAATTGSVVAAKGVTSVIAIQGDLNYIDEPSVDLFAIESTSTVSLPGTVTASTTPCKSKALNLLFDEKNALGTDALLNNFAQEPIKIATEQASIVKSWDAAKEPQVYSANNPLNFTITVYNESDTEALTGFTVTDKNFGADVTTSMSCSTTEPGLPVGPYDLAKMTAGVAFKPTTPIPVGGNVAFTCVSTVIAAPVTLSPAVITNTAKLSPFDPLLPDLLQIVSPKTGTKSTAPAAQTDNNQNTTVNSTNNAEDSITAIPLVKKYISIQKAFVTDPKIYKAGTPLNFTIKITNEGLSPILQINLADDSFGGKVTGMTCDKGFTTFAGQDILLTIPLNSKAVLTITCTAVAPAGDLPLTNKATLKPFTGDVNVFIVMPQTLSQSDKDPFADLTTPNQNTVLAQNDSITVPPTPQASIVKAWKSKPSPFNFAVGSDISYTLKVTNESPVGGANLTNFTLDDDGFGGKGIATTCTAIGATFASPYTAQAIVITTPATGLAPQTSITFDCTAKATALNGTANIVNVATLSQTATFPITIVKPVLGGVQSDEDATTKDAVDTTFAKDSLSIPPLGTPKVSVKKAWTGTAPKSYKPGEPFAYEITITNEGIVGDANVTNFTLNDNDFATFGTTTTCTSTPAGTTFASPFTNVAVTATPALEPTKSIVFACVGTYKATATGTLVNTVTLSETAGSTIAIVEPKLKQTDADVSTQLAADATFAKDSIVVPPAPKVSLKKAWNGTAPTQYIIGSPLKYDIIITNEGTTDITNFTLTDDQFGGNAKATTCTSVPAGVTFTGVTAAQPIVATIVGSGNIKFTCDAVVTAGTATLVNVATISETTGFPISIVEPVLKQTDADVTTQNAADAKFEKDSIIVPPAGAPKVSVKKAWTPDPLTYDVGTTLIYTITIKNEGIVGDADLTKFTLSDDGFKGLAEATKCTSTPAEPTFAAPFTAQSIVLATPLKPTVSLVFTCEAPAPAVVPSAPATLVNTVTLSATTGSPIIIVEPTGGQTDADASTKLPLDAAFAKDSIIVLPKIPTPKASIVKAWATGKDPVVYTLGTPLVYTITIKNEGDVEIKEFNLYDDGFATKAVAPSCTGDFLFTPAIPPSTVPTTVITTIAVGASATITCTATAPAKSGELVNTATLSEATGKPLTVVAPTSIPGQSDGLQTLATDIPKDSIKVPPSGQPVISLIKKWTLPAPLSYTAGTKLDFQIVVTNEGAVDVVTFKLTDDIFKGATNLGTMSCTGGAVPFTTFAGQTFTYTAGQFIAGSSQTFDCTVSVVTASTTELVNTATIESIPVNPVTIIAPKATPGQSDGLQTLPTDIPVDSIKVPPAVIVIPQASIVKSFKTATTQYDGTTDLTYLITITNEGDVPVTEFTVTDDLFLGDANIGVTACTNGLATPFKTATIKPVAPALATKGSTYVIECTSKVIAAPGVLATIVNTATLSKATDPLTIVAPTVNKATLDQTDKTYVDAADIAKDSITATPIVIQSASIVKEWVDTNVSTDEEYGLLSVLSFTITVTNEGDVPLTDFTITDDLFLNSTNIVISACDKGLTTPFATKTLALTATDVPAKGDTYVITCTAGVKAGTLLADLKPIFNTVVLSKGAKDLVIVKPTANVLTTPQSDGDVTDAINIAKDTITATPKGVPSASIVKSWKTLTTTYDGATDLTFLITITNEGTVPVTEFKIDDNLFSADANISVTTCDKGLLTPFSSATIKPSATELVAKGDVYVITCTAKVVATPGTLAPIVNSATLSAGTTPLSVVAPSSTTLPQTDGKDGTAIEAASDSITATPKAIPTASIQKKFTATTLPTDYKAGSDVSYTITITNEGSVDVTEFTIADDLFGADANIAVSTCDKGLVTPFKTATIKATIIPGGSYIIKCTAAVIAAPVLPLKTIINTAILTKATDPLIVVTPVKGPAQTDGLQTLAADIPKDSITLPPAGSPKASIVKAWAPTKTVTTYKAGDALDFTITIKNEGTVAITEFKLTDDLFGGKVLPADITCTGTFTFVAPFTGDIVLAAPLAPSSPAISVTCSVKAPASTVKLTNKATLVGTANQPLTVVAPTPGPQSDGNIATQADIESDSVTIDPTPVTPIYTIKKIVDTTPNLYTAGSTINYTIRIRNYTPAVAIKQVKLIDDCGAAQLENCVLIPAPNTAYDTTTNVLSGMVWTPAPTGTTPDYSETTVKYSGKVKATAIGNIINTAKLDPTLPINPIGVALLPVCATDPTMQDFTNADGTIKACEDDVLTPPSPVLSIRKVLTSAKTTFAPGDTITYDIVLTKVAGTITQVKVTDDCAGGLLEGPAVAPATTGKCTLTSASGTFDTATGILSSITWSATNEAIVKVTGTVKLGTKTDVVNVATFDKTFPADPKNPTILPACSIDPKMTNADGTVPSAADCNKDEVKVTPIPPVVSTDRASIVKAWDFFTGYFTLGNTLSWTVTVTNEGTTDLAKFNIKDDNFAQAKQLDESTLDCTTKTAGPAFTSAQMIAGFDFVPTTPLKPGEFVEFACTVDVIEDGVEGETLTNTATLSSAAGQTLTRVVPTALQQSDLDVTTQAEIDSDHLYVDPEVFIPNTSYISVIKSWSTKNGKAFDINEGYSVGDELTFLITVANESQTNDIYAFTLQDDEFDGATNLSKMVCDKGYTNFKGQEFTSEDIFAPIIEVDGNFVIKCTVKVLADSNQTLKNTVTIIFPEGEVFEPSVGTQTDGMIGDPSNDAKDSIKISPKPKTIIPVIVTPRTGGQIAIGASIVALLAVAFLTLRKRMTVKK